jgi:eukaryotic-like serine/threonine-protein kinase
VAEHRRPPWWMHLVLVLCAAYLVVLWGVLVAGPERLGCDFDPRPDGFSVTSVTAGSTAERAGLRPGDVVLTANDKTGRDAQWELRSTRVGQELRLLVDRQGVRTHVVCTLGRKGRAWWTSPVGLAHLADVPAAALCTLLAWLIVFRGRPDATSRVGALMLALSPVGNTYFVTGSPPGLSAAIHALPAPIAALPIGAILLAAAVLTPLALVFFASFPSPRLRGRWWVWLVAGAPNVLLGLPLTAVRLRYALAPTPLPPLPATFFGLVRLAMAIQLAFLIAVPIVLLWNYRHLTGISERRRVRVMVAGLLVDGGFSVVDGALRVATSAVTRSGLLPALQGPVFLLGAAGSMVGPAAIAYGILRHRVLDVGVLVRQGLQYAIARRALLALAPLLLGILVLDLAVHSDQTLAQVFLARGWLYAALAAAALFAHAKSRTWLPALDRAFFRERYDARRILRDVLTDVRQTTDLGTAASHAVSQIDAALHPGFAAILVRRPDEPAFRVAASSGEPPAPPDIRADGKLMALVRVLGKPVEISQSDTGWLRRQLPAEETDGLARARVEWIFPIALGADRAEGLLVLGPKRSEEPYTQEDQDLVEAIASALAVVAERTTPGVPSRAEKAVFETAETAVLRIAERYVVRRELGRGGMGTVYEARDTELERGVALKVMRPELLSSPEAASRFKREARAAAGLSHPNVVTVYDFGVAPDGRAYLVMELLVGDTLREALRRDGRFPPSRARAVLAGVCAAVEAAHERHLLHRDLKPENVFLVRAGDIEIPKVLDFGVAKALDTGEGTPSQVDTGTGQLVGTLAYMSPEQLQGSTPESAWDVWALTVIAYEMLTGAHPYAGSGRPVHAAVLAGRCAPPSQHLGDDTRQWDALFAQALNPDPSQRPATPCELLARFGFAAAS